jgi:hypothetical protein
MDDNTLCVVTVAKYVDQETAVVGVLVETYGRILQTLKRTLTTDPEGQMQIYGVLPDGKTHAEIQPGRGRLDSGDYFYLEIEPLRVGGFYEVQNASMDT